MAPRYERPKPTGILREILKNACSFEDTLAPFGLYSVSSTDLNSKINGCVQVGSTESSGESNELVAEGVVKLLDPRKTCSTIDAMPKNVSQAVRVLTLPPSTNAIAVFKRTLNRNSQTFKAPRRDISTTSNTLPWRISSFEEMEVVTTNSVHTGPRPTESTKT